MECKFCRYYISWDGCCHRYPPLVTLKVDDDSHSARTIVKMKSLLQMVNIPQEDGEARWPIVKVDDWCGEWEKM